MDLRRPWWDEWGWRAMVSYFCDLSASQWCILGVGLLLFAGIVWLVESEIKDRTRHYY